MIKHISLPLAEDTTETHCGGCRNVLRTTEAYCDEYAFTPVGTSQRLRKLLVSHEHGPLRLPECLAAEQSHADLVRDAALGAAVRGRIADAARNDGCTLFECAERIATEHAMCSADPDVRAAFDVVATHLQEEQGR